MSKTCAAHANKQESKKETGKKSGGGVNRLISASLLSLSLRGTKCQTISALAGQRDVGIAALLSQ